MSTVEPVFEVDLGLSDEIVGAEEVPVQQLQGQHGVLGEGSLDLEAPAEESTLVKKKLNFPHI